MATARFTRTTKFLHFGLAMAVTIQLLVAQIMEPPKPTRIRTALESTGYEIHEWVGIVAVIFTLLHWLHSLRTTDDARTSILFPWSNNKRGAAFAELRGLLRGKPPSADRSGSLASLVHGLGFLVATAMAVSGVMLFVGWPEIGPIPQNVKLVAKGHEFVANLMWAYWVGHVALAIWHQVIGHRTLTNMMRFWQR